MLLKKCSLGKVDRIDSIHTIIYDLLTFAHSIYILMYQNMYYFETLFFRIQADDTFNHLIYLLSLTRKLRLII